MKLFVVFDLGFCGVILGGTMLFLHGMKRTNAVGLICAAFNLSVFASPLSIMVLHLSLFFFSIFFYLKFLLEFQIYLYIQIC